jgi:hypothetical protein
MVKKEYSAFDGSLLAVALLDKGLAQAYLGEDQKIAQRQEKDRMWKTHLAMTHKQ